MSNVFGDIIGALGKVGGGLGTATGAVSPIASLFGMINQFSLAQKEKAAMDRANYYAKHPEAVSNMVAAATKPLSSGLTSSVSNVVNANLAEQGLSQAPGIQSQVLAQALAPYQQNEQQMALTQVLKTLGLPIEALGAIQSTMRPNQLSQMIAGLPGSGSQPNIPYPYPSIPTGPPDPYGGLTPTPPFDPTQPLPGSDTGALPTFASYGAGYPSIGIGG